MAWRKSHGRKRDLHGEGIVWENAHTDPAPKPPPGAGGTIVRDKGGKVRSSEAARALAQLRRAPNFIPRDVQCSEAFKPFNATRRKLTKQRITELFQQTGGISRGVGARVRSACWGFAFGEYLAAQAAESGDPDLMDKAMSVLAKASVEDEKARRLAVDEAHARPRQSPAERIAARIAATKKDDDR